MKQVKCECGRIAEVRRRKNGKKLRYIHCVADCKHSGLGNAAKAAEIKAQESVDIGAKGDFWQDQSEPKHLEPSKVNLESEPELETPASAVTTCSTSKSDWKPDPEDQPEVLEPTVVAEPEKAKPACGAASTLNGGGAFKVVLGIFTLLVFGGGAYAYASSKG